MGQRWNNGVGAVTCDACGRIIKYGFLGEGDTMYGQVHLCEEHLTYPLRGDISPPAAEEEL